MPQLDPTHGNGLWNPEDNPMPLFVVGSVVLAVILLASLMVVVIWALLKSK